MAPELARINAPIAAIARDFQAEREARKVLRDKAVASGASGVTPPVAAADSPPVFSREMSQSAAAWWLMACSDPALENPLLAGMTEFWFNPLNVFVGKSQVRPCVGHYVANAIRAHALGRFEDLLLASARHPAMLLYLDQAQSSNRGLNENHARERMELHTLGVQGGYTQDDVHELARTLTGWAPNLQAGEGFQLANRRHDSGSKRFMGQTYSNDGVKEGLARGNLNEGRDLPAHHDCLAMLAQVLRGSFALGDSQLADLLPGARWDPRLDGLLHRA